MVSEFRKKKLLYIFEKFFDVDSSGSIEKKDLDYALERISKARGWTPSDAKYNEIKAHQDKMWTTMQSRADANNDGKISKDEWIAMWDQFVKNPSAATEWQNMYCKISFTIQDVSDDGSIDCDEFIALHIGFGQNKDDAVEAYQKLTKGTNGTITWDEYRQLFKEYFAAEDVNAPGNFIFGKTSF